MNVIRFLHVVNALYVLYKLHPVRSVFMERSHIYYQSQLRLQSEFDTL